jgi:hypothetical protein
MFMGVLSSKTPFTKRKCLAPNQKGAPGFLSVPFPIGQVESSAFDGVTPVLGF